MTASPPRADSGGARAFTTHDLMREVLQMTARRHTDPARFSALATAAGIHPLDARIYFLTQLRERLRLLPLKLFVAPEAREQLLESLQAALDAEIGQEESA